MTGPLSAGVKQLAAGNHDGNGSDMAEDDVAAQNASARQYDWRPRPDPTVLTTQQLRETEVSILRTVADRIAGLRELLGQRLEGMDQATVLLSERIERIIGDEHAAREHLREEVTAARHGQRELLEARLDAIDRATRLLASDLANTPGDIEKQATNLREFLLAQIAIALAETKRVGDVTQEKFAAIDGLFNSNDKALTAALAAQEKAAAEQQKSNTLAIDKSEKTTQETIRANDAKTASSIEAQGQTIADLKERVVRVESGGVATATARTEQRADLGTTTTTVQAMIMGLAILISLISVVAFVLKK